MGFYQKFSRFGHALSTKTGLPPSTINNATGRARLSPPSQYGSPRTPLWAFLLMGLGLVLTLAWAGTFLWWLLSILGDIVAWLLA